MCAIGLSVPPGMTITTETCAAFHTNGSKLPDGVWEEVLAGLAEVEGEMGTKLGDATNPLLLSVRSGAAVSHSHSIPFLNVVSLFRLGCVGNYSTADGLLFLLILWLQ
jgi:phosphoenolpyruvate synthase/pyruvate phosphate dikinase